MIPGKYRLFLRCGFLVYAWNTYIFFLRYYPSLSLVCRRTVSVWTGWVREERDLEVLAVVNQKREEAKARMVMLPCSEKIDWRER